MEFVMAGALVIPLALMMFVLPWLADGECRSFLAAWLEERGMTLLRCRRCWLVPQLDTPPSRVVYRLTTVDRQGWLRSGWATFTVRFTAGEVIATAIDVRWVRARAIPRPVGLAHPPPAHPVWDRWVDRS